MKLRLISGLLLAMACMPSFQVTAKSEHKKMPEEDIIILYLRTLPVVKETAAAIAYVKTNYAKTGKVLLVGAFAGAFGGFGKKMFDIEDARFQKRFEYPKELYGTPAMKACAKAAFTGALVGAATNLLVNIAQRCLSTVEDEEPSLLSKIGGCYFSGIIGGFYSA